MHTLAQSSTAERFIAPFLEYRVAEGGEGTLPSNSGILVLPLLAAFRSTNDLR